MPKQNRLFQYDFIRAIAMLYVIAVHSLVVIDFTDPTSYNYFLIMQAVFFTCNGMFFMMSGRFALESATTTVKYYYKKFESIILPMLFFFALRTLYQSDFSTFSLGLFFKNYFINILGGLSGTEYWFLYVLIGNLFLAPLLAKAFNCFSTKEHILFIVLGLLHHFFLTVCTIKQIPYNYVLVFSGWSFYFYLGYSAEKIFKKTHYLRLWLIGLHALLITTYLKYIGIVTFVHDVSPLFTLIVIAMYFLLYTVSSHVSDALKPVFCFLAKHSFSVFL